MGITVNRVAQGYGSLNTNYVERKFFENLKEAAKSTGLDIVNLKRSTIVYNCLKKNIILVFIHPVSTKRTLLMIKILIWCLKLQKCMYSHIRDN